MDKYDAQTVQDSLPRILEMVADTDSFVPWLTEQGIDHEFLFAAALAIRAEGHNPVVAFLVATCVAWEVAKR